MQTINLNSFEFIKILKINLYYFLILYVGHDIVCVIILILIFLVHNERKLSIIEIILWKVHIMKILDFLGNVLNNICNSNLRIRKRQLLSMEKLYIAYNSLLITKSEYYNLSLENVSF